MSLPDRLYPAFQWRGEKPGVGTDAFVLAINGEGVACDKPHGERGPSIVASSW
ncbi:MAG: hypothetical protein U0165_01340 [Polyangiaceae bacterium]